MAERSAPRYRTFGLALLVLTLVLDRITKEWLLGLLDGQDPITVTGFLDLVMVWNRGVSFGLFQQGDDAGRYLLTGFAVIVALVLIVWMWRSSTRIAVTGLALVAGGALGNAYDRVVYGAVADFFDFHFSGYHFWAFNIADSAITIGVGFLLLDAFRAPAAAAGR
ncbi:signal peptidase II [Zavarzinia compransoris]|uniref:Lipoprotein signal peptidase n=1 Tax=Zavarzinia compransoris TaxID=1264899 RepID=A0A317E8V8_9PROT|nr:signal peptidase II [Zavarzinia compransoris]PWR23557.1 signal peptidase II [Zavarzinia compransoris]TDP47769.1 signal peptidase II [Zavarzinia compransoris]